MTQETILLDNLVKENNRKVKDVLSILESQFNSICENNQNPVNATIAVVVDQNIWVVNLGEAEVWVYNKKERAELVNQEIIPK